MFTITDKTKHIAVTASFLLLTAIFSILCLTHDSIAVSDAERRPLAQMPEYSTDKLLNGNYFSSFENYTVDQFPLRDTFRSLKAFLQTEVWGRHDNNGYFQVDSYIGKTDYPLNSDSVLHAADRIQYIYDHYLSEGNHNILYSVIPDKSFFLAPIQGYPTMDYDALLQILETQLSDKIDYVDIFNQLDIHDYYQTDTHWSQDRLGNVVSTLANALHISDSLSQKYTTKTLYSFPEP